VDAKRNAYGYDHKLRWLKTRGEKLDRHKGKRITTPETYKNSVDKTSSKNTSSADKPTDGQDPTYSGGYPKTNTMGPADMAFNVYRNGFNAYLGGNAMSLGFLTD
jgi:hypothetical protein